MEVLQREKKICSEAGRRQCGRVPTIDSWGVFLPQSDPAGEVAERQAEKCGKETGVGEHRAAHAHRDEDANQRQSDRSGVAGHHHCVIHPCLT